MSTVKDFASVLGWGVASRLWLFTLSVAVHLSNQLYSMIALLFDPGDLPIPNIIIVEYC